ncbi:unnamed protein product [Schistosoma rodhaini]|uniref:Uncharacterized protein n=1 Tax=Schistosoma rodhaini TaxID=6188 RepID=A0AA85GAC0_9TREM|nr:unnamed protein product [Schistosoma rodhaini]
MLTEYDHGEKHSMFDKNNLEKPTCFFQAFILFKEFLYHRIHQKQEIVGKLLFLSKKLLSSNTFHNDCNRKQFISCLLISDLWIQCNSFAANLLTYQFTEEFKDIL